MYPYDNTSYVPVELGASVFVEVNKNMWRAVDEFNLTRTNFKDEDEVMGIWDGEKFLLTVRRLFFTRATEAEGHKARNGGGNGGFVAR